MEIERIDAPARGEFEQRWVRPAIPVVIRGAMEDWPARALWSVDYFTRRFGEQPVPVARTAERRVVHGPRTGFVFSEQRLADYLARPEGYVMFLLHQYVRELAEDVRTPSFCPETRWAIRKLWLSPADTRSPLHQDLPDNLYAQVIGRKKVTLISPAETRHLYRQPIYSKEPQVSRVDAEAPDYDAYPKFRRARPLTLVLEPGELLYLPRRWWHQMRSIDFSASLNYWWATGATYWLVRAALAYQKVRALRY